MIAIIDFKPNVLRYINKVLLLIELIIFNVGK